MSICAHLWKPPWPSTLVPRIWWTLSSRPSSIVFATSCTFSEIFLVVIKDNMTTSCWLVCEIWMLRIDCYCAWPHKAVQQLTHLERGSKTLQIDCDDFPKKSRNHHNRTIREAFSGMATQQTTDQLHFIVLPTTSFRTEIVRGREGKIHHTIKVRAIDVVFVPCCMQQVTWNWERGVHFELVCWSSGKVVDSQQWFLVLTSGSSCSWWWQPLVRTTAVGTATGKNPPLVRTTTAHPHAPVLTTVLIVWFFLITSKMGWLSVVSY